MILRIDSKMRGWMLNQTRKFSGALCRTKPNEYQMIYRINDFINTSYVSHESDAYREKTFIKNIMRALIATWMEFMLIIEHQSNPTNAYYVICKCHNATKTLVAKSTAVQVATIKW